MTVIVDTGVLYADHDTDAHRNEVAAGAIQAVYDSHLGQPFVSDYIYDEAVTLTLQRSGRFDAAKRLGERLRGGGQYPPTYRMLRIDSRTFEHTVEIFEQYDDQRLSFTDASTIALVREHDIDTVLSFDDDFDGLVDRTEPGDLERNP